MTNILLVNGHQPFPSSPGRLNASFLDRASNYFESRECAVQHVAAAGSWGLDDEVQKQLWADFILFQFPLNSMGLPWSLKRYLDEVYTAGMDGRLAKGDGRSRKAPESQYGSGGRMQGRSYGLSVTLNAPATAFSDPKQDLFAGLSLDELLAPVHVNFAFFGLSRQATFAAYDVKKSPDIDQDFERFDRHLDSLWAGLSPNPQGK